MHFWGGGRAQGREGVGEGRGLRDACSTLHFDFLGTPTCGSESDFLVSSGLVSNNRGGCLTDVVGSVAVLSGDAAIDPGSTLLRGGLKRRVRCWDAAGLIATDLIAGCCSSNDDVEGALPLLVEENDDEEED